jgi:acyl-CoA thioester hydrolase
MMKQGFGPVIFKEEAIFRREINLHDSVTLNVKVAALRKDASRWTMRQEFRSYPENELKAIVTIEGAWLDIRHRKLLDKIPASVLALLDLFERTEDFEWLDN